MGFRQTVYGMGLCFTLLSPAFADEIPVPAQNREDLAITIYQNNQALIAEKRMQDLPSADMVLALEGVSRALVPDSLLLSSPILRFGERRFAFETPTPHNLLRASLGKTVRFIRRNPQTGDESEISAKILAVDGGLVIERNGRIETGEPGSLALAELPEGMRLSPSILVNTRNGSAGKSTLELAYLSGAMNWRVAYSAALSEDQKQLTISGLANLTNQTGVDFHQARITLAAGDARAQQRRPIARSALKTMAAQPMMAEAAMDGLPSAEATGQLYLYPLAKPLDLNDQQDLQVPFLENETLAVTPEIVVSARAQYAQMRPNSRDFVHGETRLLLTNSLGKPLPSGMIRIYGLSQAKERVFLGEDNLDAIPDGEKIVLNLGQSFDVTASRQQNHFEFLSQDRRKFEIGYDIVVKNAAAKAQSVRLEEQLSGQWEINSESHRHELDQNGSPIWKISVPAHGEVTVKYRATIRP